MHAIPVDEAKAKLTDLVEEALRGGDVVLVKDGQAAVRLVPVPVSPSRPRPQFGNAEGLITMSDDFDKPLEDFAEYMQ